MRNLFLCGASALVLMPFAAMAQNHPPAMESIIVTASPMGTGSDHLATIPSTVNAQQILQNGGSNLADSLASIPGVSSSGFAAGASRPIIRGMDASRVRVLEDGTSSSDASDIGPDHGVPIDPLSARSIEVVRGAATLRYGSQAIGGVVNAINNRVPLTITDQTAAEATMAYDTVSDARQVAALVDTGTGPFAFHADGFYRHTDDYDTPLGRQANSFFKGDGLSLGGSYFMGDNSRVGAALIHYDSRYGVPSDITFIDMHQSKLLLGSSFDMGDGLLKTLNVNGSYGDYIHKEKDPNGTVNATFKNKEFDIRGEALLGAIGPLTSTAIGVEIQNRAFSALGAGADYLSPTLTNSQAGFIFSEALVGDLHIQASGRIEHVTVKGTPLTNVQTVADHVPVSGALGFLYDVSNAVKLGLTMSSTARAPAQTELFARGPHDGPGTYETGNPNLRMERANSLEGTLRLRMHEFVFDGSVYTTSFNNYIYGALTGRNCDEMGVCAFGSADPLKQLSYTQSGASFRGLEGKASYHLWHDQNGILELKVLGDYVRASLAGGGNVPRIPPWRFGGGLSWESDPVDAGFQLMQVGEQDKPGAFDTPTPGYLTLDAQVSWRPFTENREIEIALITHNLTDAVARNATSLNKDVVVMPGRNIRIALKYATN